jgi:putative transposon-encoded protein
MLSRKFASIVAVVFLLGRPAQAQTTIQPFGNGAIVNTPGQPPTTVQPFGNGTIVNTPGQVPSTIQPFGSGAIVNTPGQPPTTVQPLGMEPSSIRLAKRLPRSSRSVTVRSSTPPAGRQQWFNPLVEVVPGNRTGV